MKYKGDNHLFSALLKAKLNQQIHTILKQKQGIGYVYVTTDFICISWFELWATWRMLELQNEKFLPTAGPESTISCLLDWCSNKLCTTQ